VSPKNLRSELLLAERIIMNKSMHQAIIKLGIAEFFVKLRNIASVFRKIVPISLRRKFRPFGKMVPHSSSFPKNDSHFLIRDNTSFRINRSDYVQWRIFYGVRDNALKCAKQYISSDSIVLDVGANCGAFSLKLATYAKHQNISNFQIHAFEPNPIVFKNLRTNLMLNPSINSIVELHPVGLGSKKEEKSFHYPDTNTGVGRVLQEDDHAQLKVSIQRLDDFVAQLNPSRIAFIKLIVEGFEPEVFKGGWNTLKKYKPPIFFEVTDEWYRQNHSSAAEVVKNLTDLGYAFSGEYYNEIVHYDAMKFSGLYQYNLLAIPT
jgi:FkbM family methyltransferase